MKIVHRIINEETKLLERIVIGDNATLSGYETMPEEMGYDGNWYLEGYAPVRPQPSYAELRAAEYPPVPEQLDMLYWDKVNGTFNWQNEIARIKVKHPKSVG